MIQVGVAAYGLPLDELLALARAAEDAGFDSVWLGEHLVVPVESRSTHPTAQTSTADDPLAVPVLDPANDLQDPWVALSAIAAVTSTLRLATGILVLPLHQPLAVARAAASLQQLSHGRFVLGVGAGWVAEEFEAVGLVFEERGHRMDEQLDVLRALWRGGAGSHHGAHFAFDDVQVTGAPVHVPVVVGGHSPAALRRAAAADGWLSSGVADLAEANRCRAEISGLRRMAGTDEPFTFHTRLSRPDPEVAERAAADGWDSLVVWADQVWPRGRPRPEQVTTLRAAAHGLGLTAKQRVLEVTG